MRHLDSAAKDLAAVSGCSQGSARSAIDRVLNSYLKAGLIAPTLTDEELAKVSADVDLGYGLHHTQARRLIAALRASRAEVERLRAELDGGPRSEHCSCCDYYGLDDR